MIDDAAGPRLRGVRRALLHRPEPPTDALVRQRLSDRLAEGLEPAGVVVCAPAGFGKSVTVSQWCAELDRPVAWLSLDRVVDDPHWLVLHLVAAVREVYPAACPVMSHAAKGAELPAMETVLVELSNELDELPGPIVVVLDDFHRLTSPECVELVSELVRHPPESVRFVLLSRQEMPPTIATLVAAGRVAEVRMGELAFTRDEVGRLALQTLGPELAPNQLDELHSSTEGWATGVRLAVEALRHSPNNDMVVGAGFLDQAAQEFLVTEVLDRTPDPVRRCLFAVSLFERFNDEVCDAAVLASGESPAMTGPEFIEWVRSHGLFVVDVDADGRWFRFHHLFARLLDTWRSASDLLLPEAEMRRAAAAVFRSHGMYEEAIEQSHLAGDDQTIVDIASERGAELIERERWRELARLLDGISVPIIENDADLLLLRAWWLGHTQARFHEMSAALSAAEMLNDHSDDDEQIRANRRGQIALLRAAYEQLPAGDIERTIEEADHACELLADSPGRELAFAYLIAAVSRLGVGRFAEAHRIAHSVIGDGRFAGSRNDPMIWTMPYVGWHEGDLSTTERFGAQLHEIGRRFDLHDADPGGTFFLGRAAYERNQLAAAETYLRQVVDLRFATRPLLIAHGWMALVLTELAQGRRRDADASAASMMQFVLALRSDYLEPVVEAFMAELDLRLGRPAAALRWAHDADPDAVSVGYPLFYNPAPTLVEVLLSSDSASDVARGRQLLEQQLALAEERCHHPLLLRLLGLRALDLAASGEEADALTTLVTAVTMSQQSGMIRRLADLGPPLAPLLHRLDVSGDLLAHVAVLLMALEPVEAAPAGNAESLRTARVAPLVAGQPALTDREFDVLTLLADRYSNKEIARELLIAPATVKKHTVTLYDKLNVHSRREAVSKARTLGYLPGAE